MIKQYTTGVIFLLLSLQCIAQPAIQWQKTFGGSGVDGANSVQRTPDGGYIFAGYSSSSDGQVTNNRGGMDCWVVKTDDTGKIQWEKTYGGSGEDEVFIIQNDVNGGYILGCATTSDDGDVSGNHGDWDAWIVKIDDTGAIVWQRLMGTSGYDYVNNPVNTSDSGYLITGSAGAGDGDVHGFHGGGGDVWVIRLSKTGSLIWDKVYGSSGLDYGLTGSLATGGGYMISAEVGAGDGDATFYYGGYADAWIIKLDDTGAIQWQRSYGGSDYELAISVLPTQGGGYIFSGSTASNDGNVTGHRSPPGIEDIWMVKIDDTGAMQWENCFGDYGDELACSMTAAADGSFVVAGLADYNRGQVSGLHGLADFWVIDVNASGTLVWQKCLGGSGNDTAFQVIQTPDSGFVVVGSTTSTDGEVTGNHGTEDIWVVKLDKPAGTDNEVTNTTHAPGIKVFPTLTTGIVNLSLPPGYENARINIINTFGQRVKELSSDNDLNLSVSMGDLPVGMYLLQVVSKNETNSFKVVYIQ